MTQQSSGGNVPLDPSWPGLDAPQGMLRVDPGVISQVGSRLRMRGQSMGSDASHLPSGVSYLDDARDSTTVGLEAATEIPDHEHWWGRWQTGVDMEHGWRTARWAILRYYKELVRQLQAAGSELEATADRYEITEMNNERELAAAAAWQRTAAAIGAAAGAGLTFGGLRESTTVPGISMCEAVHNYDVEWICQEVAHLRHRQPWVDMSSQASALRATGDRLDGLSELLKGEAIALEEAWCSPAAAGCQQALRLIAGTAGHLGERAHELAEFTARSADTIATAVSGFPETERRSVGQWIADTATLGSDPHREAQEQEIRDALLRLNQAYTDVNTTVRPPDVNADLPEIVPSAENDREDHPVGPPMRPDLPTPPAGSGGGAGSAADAPPASVGGVPVGGVPAVGGSAAGVPAGAVATPGAASGAVGLSVPELSTGGLAGAGAGTGGGPAPGPVPGGAVPGGAAPGVGPAGAVATGPGAGAGVVGTAPGVIGGAGAAGTGAARGAGGVAGAGAGGGAPARGMGPTVMGAPMAGAGAAGGAAGRGAVGAPGRGAGATGAGRPGTLGGMMPAGAGAAGRGGRDEAHQRPDGWLIEDDDPWRGDLEAPPEVIQ